MSRRNHRVKRQRNTNPPVGRGYSIPIDGRFITAARMTRDTTPFVLSDEERIKHLRLLFRKSPWEKLQERMPLWKLAIKRLILVVSNSPGADAECTRFGNLSGADLISTDDYSGKSSKEIKRLMEKYAVVLLDIDVRAVFNHLDDLTEESSCLYAQFMGPTTYIVATKFTTECLATTAIRSLALKTHSTILKETYIENKGHYYWVFNKHSMERRYSEEQSWLLDQFEFTKPHSQPSTYWDTYIPTASEFIGYNLHKARTEHHPQVRDVEINGLPHFLSFPYLFKDLNSLRISVDERAHSCDHQTFMITARSVREVHVSFDSCRVPCVDLDGVEEDTERFTLVNKNWSSQNPFGSVCALGEWNGYDQAHWMVDGCYTDDTYNFVNHCKEIKLVGVSDTYLMLLREWLGSSEALVWKRLVPTSGIASSWPLEPELCKLYGLEILEIHDLLDKKTRSSDNPTKIQFDAPYLREFKHVALPTSNRAWIPSNTFGAGSLMALISKISLLREFTPGTKRIVVPIKSTSFTGLNRWLKDITISGFLPMFIVNPADEASSKGFFADTGLSFPKVQRLSIDISDIPVEKQTGPIGATSVKLMVYAERSKFPALEVLQLTTSQVPQYSTLYTEHRIIEAVTCDDLETIEIADEIKFDILILNGRQRVESGKFEVGKDGLKRWELSNPDSTVFPGWHY